MKKTKVSNISGFFEGHVSELINLHFFPPPLYGLIKSRGLNLWDLPKDFRKYHCPKTVASVSNADLWHLEMFAWIVMQLMGRVVKRRGIYINEKW